MFSYTHKVSDTAGGPVFVLLATDTTNTTRELAVFGSQAAMLDHVLGLVGARGVDLAETPVAKNAEEKLFALLEDVTKEFKALPANPRDRNGSLSIQHDDYVVWRTALNKIEWRLGDEIRALKNRRADGYRTKDPLAPLVARVLSRFRTQAALLAKRRVRLITERRDRALERRLSNPANLAAA